MSAEAIVSVVIAAIGSIFWFARLEGRVNTQEQLHKSLKDDVQYIRERIDSAINGKH